LPEREDIIGEIFRQFSIKSAVSGPILKPGVAISERGEPVINKVNP
jgi:hypothetical protein